MNIPLSFFPLTVAALELVAGAVYFWNHEWRIGIVWVAVGIANAAFAGVK